MRRFLLVLFHVLFFSLVSVSTQEKIKIAVMDFKPGVGVSEYTVDGISEMLISSLFDTRKFSIIERTQIDKVFVEKGFQKSNVSTNQIAQVGKILGVKYVLIGIVNFIITERTLDDVLTSMAKGEYNIDVRIVNVENGEVVSTAGTGVKESETIRSVMPKLAKELAGKIEDEQSGTEGKEYKIGGFGPAGGIIFYDKGIYSNNWRYLEVAPVESEFEAEWGAEYKYFEGGLSNIGSGKNNTRIIVELLNQLGETRKAAMICDELIFDGYDDWFLPSIDELSLINKNSREKAVLSNNNSYWSSSTNGRCTYYLGTNYGGFTSESDHREEKCLVRAVRAF